MSDDRPLDSEEMLRRAREGLGRPFADPTSGRPRHEEEQTPSSIEPEEEREPENRGSPRPPEPSPRFERATGGAISNAEFRSTGSTLERMRGTRWELIVDGESIAEINSRFETSGFVDASDHRVATVSFTNGDEWQIVPVEPGPRAERETVFGKTKEIKFHAKERVITVLAGDNVIARTVGELTQQLFQRTPFTVEAAGRSYSLLPSQQQKTGTIEGYGELNRSGPPGKRTWTLSTTSGVPLSVVLIHHHVLIRDWHTESSN